MTPQALYDELARNAQHILSVWGDDGARRQARMKAPLPEEDKDDNEDAADPREDRPLRHADKYGLDIDGEFRVKKFQKRFKHWEEVIKIANEVLIDEMRTLLEFQP